jgi:hypothetical protein
MYSVKSPPNWTRRLAEIANMEDYLQRPILITGLPRSGTSMVAGLFDTCGAWTGTTIPGNAANPRGYFEHAIIREEVTKKILKKLGHGPLGVISLPPLNLTMKVDGLCTIISDIIQRDGYDGESPWLYKDAKMSLIWPAFEKAFPEAQWIIVNRDTEAVIDSCLRTPFMAQHSSDRYFWESFAAAYQQRLDRLANNVQSVISLQSDDILAGNYQSLAKVIRQCGLVFSEDETNAFVCNDYWHSG